MKDQPGSTQDPKTGRWKSEGPNIPINPQQLGVKLPEVTYKIATNRSLVPNRQRYFQIAIHQKMLRDGYLTSAILKKLEKVGLI